MRKERSDKDMKTEMKVLFAASEARPFIVTGALADIAESLPQSLVRKGVDCRVVIPLYSMIPYNQREDFSFVTSFTVKLSWRKLYCGVFKTERDGVIYYFIDNEHYFHRYNLFEGFDNAEKYAFFSLAVLEMLPHIDFQPDVIHANDWETALVPIFRHIHYAQSSFYSGIKTVFSIHNIAFQGITDFSIFGDVFGFPDWAGNLVDYDGRINLTKGAMETCHAMVISSRSYAREIEGECTDMSGYDYGSGLTPFFRERKRKLTTIPNGVDGNDFDPLHDVCLSKNYGKTNFRSGKKENKTWLQVLLSLEKDPDVPIVAMISKINSQYEGCQRILDTINKGLMDDNHMQFVLLGNAASGEIASAFSDFADRYPGRAAVFLSFNPLLAKKILAGADIMYAPLSYEPFSTTQIIALRYGTISLIRNTGGLADMAYDSIGGEGICFNYSQNEGDDLKAAIERALNAFSNKKEWNMLVRSAMKCDYSWDNHAANEYIKLYNSLCITTAN